MRTLAERWVRRAATPFQTSSPPTSTTMRSSLGGACSRSRAPAAPRRDRAAATDPSRSRADRSRRSGERAARSSQRTYRDCGWAVSSRWCSGRTGHAHGRRRPRSAEAKKKAAKKTTKKARSLSAAQRNRLAEADFAFPKERKEPLVDCAHVRNAISRFDQVEDVTNAERDRAWKRIVAAAKKFGVEVSEHGWRELFHGGKAPAKKKATEEEGDRRRPTKKAAKKTADEEADKKRA